MNDIDFGLTADDYARYRAGFPDSLFERLRAWGIGQSGQKLVDLGTGTGTLARGFASRGCKVIGIDPSTELVAQAKALDKATGVAVEYRQATAEETGLPADSFDVVSAGQCWHWFERSRAAREVARILKPDAYIVIVHFDWLPLPGNILDLTENLIYVYNPAWRGGGGNGLHPAWLTDLGKAAYREIETFSYDVAVPYTHEAWRGRIRASAGVGASLPPEKVAAFDREFKTLLQENYPEDVLSVPHRVFAVIAKSPV